MKKILFVLLCTLYIIGPILNTSIGQYADPILIISSIFTLVFFLSNSMRYYRNIFHFKSFEMTLWIFQIYLVMPLFVAYVYPQFGYHLSLSDFIRPIRILLTLYSGCVIVLFGYKIYGDALFEKLLKIVVLIMCFNAAIMCFQSVSEEFRNLVDSVLFRIDDGVNRYGIELRASGCFMSGGALPSVFQTIVTIFIPYLILRKQFSFGFGMCIALFLFLTSILTGRSGLLCFLPFIYLVAKLLPRNMLLYILLGFLVFIIVVISYLSVIESQAILYAIERFTWIGKDGTADVLIGKLSIPNNFFIFLFGVLNFDNSIYTKVSDMGFNINLWTYGILGWILFYSTYCVLFKNVLKSRHYACNVERLVAIVFMCTYLFFEIKENMMYARNGLSILSLVVFGYMLHKQIVIKKIMSYDKNTTCRS